MLYLGLMLLEVQTTDSTTGDSYLEMCRKYSNVLPLSFVVMEELRKGERRPLVRINIPNKKLLNRTTIQTANGKKGRRPKKYLARLEGAAGSWTPRKRKQNINRKAKPGARGKTGEKARSQRSRLTASELWRLNRLSSCLLRMTSPNIIN